MKALVWRGINDVRTETVPDPVLLQPTDAIVEVTSTAICGSDLHLHDGYIPGLVPGDILGHEFMGRVVEAGSEVRNLKVGDRVVVPFTISCGQCEPCRRGEFSLCDNTNPNAGALEAAYGYSGAGLFGYSHLYGGYAGGQAQYVRVPYADWGPMKVPDGLPDEKLLFLTDILPTGWQAAEQANVKPGDTVAVWGAGPVGIMTALSAFQLGAAKVIVVDRFPERLALASRLGAITVNYEDGGNVLDEIKELTAGRGPDSCVDAVGMEAHGHGVAAAYDQVKHFLRLGTDRPTALREAIQACRKGGTVSVPGVYGGLLDKMNFGAAFAKGLTFRMGQTHVQRYLPRLLELVEGGLDTSFIISHRLGLSEAPHGYEIFKNKQEGCTKIVLDPTA
ncbi:MAG TPA: zinc-dependent alcohol dehydrogenase [Deinococcales bacterium]|nr:zinc-dependent alcohol dehydrogenase [Deinococcales bacterium]